MKKIFIVGLNFFLFSYEYSFSSYGTCGNFIWNGFENAKKNDTDTREFVTTGEGFSSLR